jgi:hypothetical protein
MHKVLSGILVATVATLWFGSTTFAGGWAVTTLDPLPASLYAGATYQIGFMMRQHGVTPIRDGTPAILLTRAGQTLRFDGRAEGGFGHYVADVTFPASGEWTWSVDQNPFPQQQTLGAINIGPPVPEPLPPLRQQPPAELALFGIVLLAVLGLVLARVAQVKRVTTPAATTATAHMASMLTQAHRSTMTPSRS